jgi:DNA helicase II / ATP-dependent DNA helicase PcrA
MPIDLSSLNPGQREAVETTEGPLLVLAGAGSGKTRVLTYRIAHLVVDLGVSPHEILAITFTNKAAAEMRERLGELVGYGVRSMWVMTFHAMCVRMLRADAERVGFKPSFTIYDEDDSKRMLKTVMRELEIDEKPYPVNAVKNRISAAKNELVGPGRVRGQGVHAARQGAARIFSRYQARMREANAMDFDDLLVEAHRLLAEHDDVRAPTDRFRYISVDEYQDTNHAQYRITNLLARQPATSWWSVTTISRSTRGAVPTSATSSSSSTTIPRPRWSSSSRTTVRRRASSWRPTPSSPTTRTASPSRCYTENVEGEKIASYLASDERDEARFIAAEIESLVRKEDRRYTDFAVFYRTNAQSRAIEDAMLRAGVPYRIVGGTRFFDRAEIRDVMRT